MIRLDHVMVRTNNLLESAAFYERVFGMLNESHDPHLEDGYELIFMKDIESGVKIELTYNVGKDDPADYVLGDRWGHISFYVDDAIAIFERAAEFGCEHRFHEHESSFGKKYIIGVVTSPEGIDIAVVQKL